MNLVIIGDSVWCEDLFPALDENADFQEFRKKNNYSGCNITVEELKMFIQPVSELSIWYTGNNFFTFGIDLKKEYTFPTQTETIENLKEFVNKEVKKFFGVNIDSDFRILLKTQRLPEYRRLDSALQYQYELGN